MTGQLRIFLLALIAAVSAPVLGAEITIENPWIQEGPPTSNTLAGYLTIHNASGKPVQLLSAGSEDFHSIELHTTEVHAGMVHMNKQHALKIDAGGSLTLEPGGSHLMLMNKKRTLRSGDKVALTLRFDTGESIDVLAEVRR